MLEMLFFSLHSPPLTKVLKPWLKSTAVEEERKNNREEINTLHQQRSRAAGCSEMVPGHARVPALVRFGDVGDPQGPVLGHSLSGESKEAENGLSSSSGFKLGHVFG